MHTMFGTALVAGVAVGPAWILDPRRTLGTSGERPVTRTELRRLEQAFALVEADLGHTSSSAEEGELSADHENRQQRRALLATSAFAEACRQAVRAERLPAEVAVERALDLFEAALGPVNDPGAFQQMHELEAAGELVLRALTGTGQRAAMPPAPGAIIVARDLDIQEMAEMERAGAAAFVTERRSPGGTELVGVPYVTGVERLLSWVAPGQRLLVDGSAGRVVIEPGQDSASP